MKKEGAYSSDILSKLMKTLDIYIERFEKAYQRKDYAEFNLIKKEIIQMQKKIAEFVE